MARADDDPLRRLLDLLAQRLELGRLVAASKWASGAPIEDPPREAVVVEAARHGAEATGTDPEVIAALVEAQITASKLLQTDLHAGWRRQGAGPTGVPPDLARDVRPALDRIGADLPVAWSAAESLLRAADGCARLVDEAAPMFADFPASASDAALAPLRRVAGCDAGHI